MTNKTLTKPNYNYEGIFLPGYSVEEIRKSILKENSDINPEEIKDWKITENPHVTTSFTKGAPKIGYADIGTQVKVVIDGYGFDREKGLFALHVAEVYSDVEDIQTAVDMTKEKTPLHITLAVGHDAKPVQSKELFTDGKEYHKFEQPIELRGSYGGLTQEGQVDILNDTERAFSDHVTQYLKDRTDEFANSFRAANAKDIDDRRLYLLQTFEQHMDGPTNYGSSFDMTSPKEAFEKIADITNVCMQQESVKKATQDMVKGIMEFSKGETEPKPTKEVLLAFQQTKEYQMLHEHLQVQQEKQHAAEEELRQKYPDLNPERIRETTERDVRNGDTRETNRTFEIPLSGKAGIMDVDKLPDDAIIYLEATHGDSISVLAAGIPKEPVEISHLVFGTNQKGECSFFITAFPGPMKPPFELKRGEMPSAYQEYTVLSKQEAQAIGISFVKYSPELPEPVREVVLKSIEQQVTTLEKRMEAMPFASQQWRKEGEKIGQLKARATAIEEGTLNQSNDKKDQFSK